MCRYGLKHLLNEHIHFSDNFNIHFSVNFNNVIQSTGKYGVSQELNHQKDQNNTACQQKAE